MRYRKCHQPEGTMLGQTPHALRLYTHLLQLQLDDLLLKGISFVLSLHVGLFNAVLLGTETAERVISQLQNGPSPLSLP